MSDKKPGWDCYWPTCDKTVKDEPLVRTNPKGHPGEFMCAQHADQRAREGGRTMQTTKNTPPEPLVHDGDAAYLTTTADDEGA